MREQKEIEHLYDVLYYLHLQGFGNFEFGMKILLWMMNDDGGLVDAVVPFSDVEGEELMEDL